MQRTFLVTGAAGFIASKVCELLLHAGHQVIGLDNLNDFYDPKLKALRLRDLSGSPLFTFHQVDIEDKPALESLFNEATRPGSPTPFNAIFHLAARAGVRPSVENPWAYYRTNTEGTLNLLDLCRRHRVTKFVLASTSSVYGGNAVAPFREDADTSRPLSPYAASKKAAEELAYAYHHLYAMDVSVVRYFTVYGPAGRPDMAVLRFIRQVSQSKPIVVYGDGHQRRDFSYVDDIAAGTISALRPVGFDCFNLGNDRPVELLTVISLIGEALGKSPQFVHEPAHPADVPETWASIDKAKKILNWVPRVMLEEGVHNTVAWYKQHVGELATMQLD